MEVETFVEDPMSQQEVEGARIVLTCAYNQGIPNRFWIWEFHQHGSRRLTIKDNDSRP